VDDWVGIEGGHDGEVVGIDDEGYNHFITPASLNSPTKSLTFPP